MGCGLGSWFPQDLLLFQCHLLLGKRSLNSLEAKMQRLVLVFSNYHNTVFLPLAMFYYYFQNLEIISKYNVNLSSKKKKYYACGKYYLEST